jgi:dihydroflavonol-4-reductase
VTGASGFIASHIVKLLLDKGYRVRGTVRHIDDPKAQVLKEFDPTGSRLELFEANLMTPGSFDVPIAGCEYVIHTASPFTMDIKSVQHDLVDPAVHGTENVLEACRKSHTVHRLIFTSSIAAVEDHPEKGRVFTESDWNQKSTLHRNPYHYSKALSERVVWNYITQLPEDERFEAVSINPSLVIGPSFSAETARNPSNHLIAQMMTNEFPGILKIGWNFVDVRDVARAHVLAMENPQAQGRYIVSNESLWMKDLVAQLKRKYPDYKYPKRNLKSKPASALIYLSSYFRPRIMGSFIRTHLGGLEMFSNEKAKGPTLGLALTPLDNTLDATVQNLQRFAIIPRH